MRPSIVGAVGDDLKSRNLTQRSVRTLFWAQMLRSSYSKSRGRC